MNITRVHDYDALAVIVLITERYVAMNIIEHVERFLGKISQGWREKSSDDGLQVVRFQNSPLEGVDTFLTLGLSHHILSLSNKKTVRQELVLPVSGKTPPDLIVSCLLSICEAVVKNHTALFRGQVVLLPNKAAEELGCQAVYCSLPVFLDDAFATFNGSEPSTVMVWVIPIHKSEADFIAANGWNKFEDVLEERDPDLFSLERDPVI